MMKIKGNPISIKHNGKVSGVHHVTCETHYPPVTVTAFTKDKRELFEYLLSEDNFQSLDSIDGDVRLVYRDSKEEIIKTEEVDVASRFGLDPRTTEEKRSERQEKTQIERLIEIIKEEMDNPAGTSLEVEEHTDRLNRCTIDSDARHYVESKIRGILSKENGVSEHQVESYTTYIYSHLYGMGILQEIDDNPEVGEIMVNGFIYPTFHTDIYYIKKGEKIRYNKEFSSIEEMSNVFSRSIAFSNKELNSVEHALVEATRSNRDRVNIIIPDASESYVMNIRKFGNFVPDLENMKASGTVNDFIDRLLKVLVVGKANIGIGGEMGTGKTTLINYLLTNTPKSERKVVVASVSETDIDRVLKGHDIINLNVDEEKGFTFQKLVRAALRTTASRIIIPESRGDEFKQVHEANLKTKGNMFTAHALDDYAFLDMCVDMYMGDSAGNPMVIRNKLANSINIVVIMRLVGKEIRIKSISEMILDDNREFTRLNTLLHWVQDKEDPTKGQYEQTDHRLSERLKERLNEYIPYSEMEGL
ncbi:MULTISPECIES: ATPase, T2SS/T4P/T4SS family [unclassified Psychrobacillus]|uniref:ATPase, T2SS/T4P/T4SS family n=1 Tax=unclassified Psychrobacillus TaxID=2636677 RepID=UPI0030F87D04